MQEIKKFRFVNDALLEQVVPMFIPIQEQVRFKPQMLEQLIDVIEEELILKKAKEIQELRNKKSAP